MGLVNTAVEEIGGTPVACAMMLVNFIFEYVGGVLVAMFNVRYTIKYIMMHFTSCRFVVTSTHVLRNMQLIGFGQRHAGHRLNNPPTRSACDLPNEQTSRDESRTRHCERDEHLLYIAGEQGVTRQTRYITSLARSIPMEL